MCSFLRIEDFLTKHIKEVDFFQAIRLLKHNANRITFSASDSNYFFWSIIESLKINHRRITVFINIAALLTKKNAKLLKNAIGDDDFLHYFINRFVWLYCNAFNQSNLMLDCSADGIQKNILFFLLNLNGVFLNQENLFNSLCYCYAGSFIHSRYSIEVLQNMLNNYFCIPFSICLYFGKWIRVSSSKQDYLTASKQNIQNIQLNKSFLGQVVFLNVRQIIMTIGPIANHDISFLPSGGQYEKLIQFLKVYLPMKINIMITVKFYSKTIKNCRLYAHYKKYGYYLGGTSYLYPIQQHLIASMLFKTTKNVAL